MASTTSATFRLTQPSSSSSSSSSSRSKPHLFLQTLHPFTSSQKPKLPNHLKSIDVEDKSILDPVSEPLPEPEFSTESLQQTDELDKRRLEEIFAVLNTGIYECKSCGYLYKEAAGDRSYLIAHGFPFDRLSEDWRCLTCGAYLDSSAKERGRGFTDLGFPTR